MDVQKSELARILAEPDDLSGPNVISNHIGQASVPVAEINSAPTLAGMCFYDEETALEYARRFERANREDGMEAVY